MWYSNYIDTTDCYSAVNKLMLFAATWVDLEIIMLSEVNQAEKDKYYMILLIYEI